MSEPDGIALDHFRILTERAGLQLSEAELIALKPMYDYYATQIQSLHDIDLGADDLAVTFSPMWEPPR